MCADLDDGFIADLRPGMAVFQKDLDGSHHVGHVHASCEGVDGDVVLISAGSDLGADVLHPSKFENVLPVI